MMIKLNTSNSISVECQIRLELATAIGNPTGLKAQLACATALRRRLSQPTASRLMILTAATTTCSVAE
ncbi:hypothetical protein GN958_ATG07937 [Phytophthora infestans]|uniref:Uncharacterized protein n=1 Tax=Phytophthora infestans TaxID=4787 RepID=A0A8S9UUV1_PHYIN|nr:hypothetical protein GN958_ATG07937 [Phytophthora infestans]